MTSPALYRRILRRESHSPRSGTAITIAVLLMLAAAWIGVEAVLAAIGRAPLLLAPQTLVSAALQAAVSPVALLVAVGAVAAIVGLILVVVSFAPGRRGRRGSVSSRTAAVVDDRVIAQAIARTASHAADVDPDQVRVSVGTRSVRVEITPTSGRRSDLQAVREAVAQDVAGYDYRPPLRSSVRMSKKATVGR